MKHLVVKLSPILLTLLAAAAFAQQPSIPEIQFDTVPNLLKLPADIYLGEAAGVALNSKGHIFVYTRSGHTRLFEFDRDGKFLREIGKDLYGFDFAHTVRVDKDDNIWCVDEGSNMVIKFNPEGRVLMLLGRKWELVEGRPEQPHPGAPIPPARPGLFNRPTDVAWDPEGAIFISDGYNNSRVAKFDKDGNWIKTWGQRGKGPGEFNIPHTIATDAKGNVYVGDRTNNRIQVFDPDGNYLKEFTGFGAPWAICISPPPNQFLFTSDSVPGRIYKLDLNGKILGVFGKAGKQPGQFGWVHEMTAASENELYVAELLNWRVQKLILHPRKGE
ncbi:MAG: 6-bladed beta-propeller [Blastocatellia bacterium AA13]|nr:MAG: 6-bladed beta-propeller [Blastocatellia bacterium AA13]